MFKNPFSFNGRIRRLEYNLSYVIFAACFVILSMIFSQFLPFIQNDGQKTIAIICIVCVILPMYWFLIAQACKRCHDKGNSGWWQLIPFYRFVLMLTPGIYGPNEYGPNPKGEGNDDDINSIGNYL